MGCSIQDASLSLTIPRAFLASLCQSPGPASKLRSSSVLAVTQARRSTAFQAWAHLPPNKARKGEDTLTREASSSLGPFPPQRVNEPL